MGAEFQSFLLICSLLKEFIVNVREVKKQKVYGDDSCPNQLQSQSSHGGLGVPGQRDGKFQGGKLNCV